MAYFVIYNSNHCRQHRLTEHLVRNTQQSICKKILQCTQSLDNDYSHQTQGETFQHSSFILQHTAMTPASEKYRVARQRYIS